MQKWNFWNPVAKFDIDPENQGIEDHYQKCTSRKCGKKLGGFYKTLAKFGKNQIDN